MTDKLLKMACKINSSAVRKLDKFDIIISKIVTYIFILVTYIFIFIIGSISFIVLNFALPYCMNGLASDGILIYNNIWHMIFFIFVCLCQLSFYYTELRIIMSVFENYCTEKFKQE